MNTNGNIAGLRLPRGPHAPYLQSTQRKVEPGAQPICLEETSVAAVSILVAPLRNQAAVVSNDQGEDASTADRDHSKEDTSRRDESVDARWGECHATWSMYRAPHEGPTVPCSSCQKGTLKENTYFTHDGEVVCARCHGVDAAHAQVERARASSMEEGRSHGVIGAVVSSIAAGQAAERSHLEIASIAGGAPIGAPSAVQCSACGTVLGPEGSVYTPTGYLVCRPCSNRWEEAARIAKGKQQLVYKVIVGIVVAMILVVVVPFFLAGLLGH